MDTIKEYWRLWLWRDAVTRIVTVNFIVWLLVSIGMLMVRDQSGWVAMFAVPGWIMALPSHIWTPISYMFTQVDFLHLLTNMLWFMLFANVFMQTQSGTRLFVLYLYGGLAGAFVFLLINAIIPSHGMMYGASCAVLAIVAASTMLVPKWHVNLLIFGSVRILWLAVAAAVFFVVLSDSVVQAVAHGSGFLMGVIYVLARRRGIDITAPLVDLFESMGRRKVLTAYPERQKYTTTATRQEEEEFDALLSKVSRSGYSSLTARERQQLFNLSQKIKR